MGQRRARTIVAVPAPARERYMRSPGYDVAIIGAGHNGLTCAAYIAAAGLKVVVLEKNGVVGGAAVTEEFYPGFRNSVAAYTVSLLHPKVIGDLKLAQHGLRIVERPVANFWPIDERRFLLFPHDLADRQRAIAPFSRRDAEQLPHYEATLSRAVAILRDLALRTPPNAAGGLLELVKNAALLRRLISISLDDQRLLVELFTKSVADFLEPWFESDVVRAAYAFDGIVGSYVSPYTPGTAYVLLHHCLGGVNGKSGVWGHAIGGMGAISDAMAKEAVARGVEIRTNARVAKLIVAARRTSGVELASGETVHSRVVAANVPPKLLFRDLIRESAVVPAVRNRFVSILSGSGSFRMNVALSELPNFRSRPGSNAQDHHASGIIIGPSIAYLERAYFDARISGWSRQPIIEMVIPSTIDPSLAPAGKHVASLFVQHVAPRLPPGRSWDKECEKQAFADLVIDTMTQHAPNFKTSIIAVQVLSPLDLENRFGLIDGDIFHGQLGIGQLFSVRPVLGYAQYRMPLEGLFLCGSGAHPGGGVSGLPGHNAAREIIRYFRRFGRRIKMR
jgi:phytoene dehydrogenase-like protein